MATLSPSDGNRFAHFTVDDHSAPIWIASIMSLAFACLILAVRLLFVKWNMHGLDDVLLTLAHLVGIGMWASLFSSLQNGLGKALKLLDVAQIAPMNQAYFASRILLFIALALSKCSMLIFIQGIFCHSKSVQRIIHVMIGVVAAWGIAGALAVSIGCSPNLIVGGQEVQHRNNDVLRLKVITIIDVITEVAIIVVPIIPLITLQMALKRKFLVMIAFLFRIINIITSIYHLVSYSKFAHDGYGGTSIASPVVWQTILLSYSFMSATIPALKGFMSGFITGGMGYTGDMSGGGGSSGNSNSYQMLALNSKEGANKDAELLVKGYPQSVAYVTSIPSGTEDGEGSRSRRAASEHESIRSESSQKIIIRKDWGVVRV